MIYPENLEVKLGFDKIRHLLKESCISPLGQAFVDKIKFSHKFDEVEKLTRQTAEFCQILSSGESFPQSHYIDVSAYLVKAALEGAYLSESEFFDLKLSMSTINDCLKFFQKTPEEEYPYLKALSAQITFEDALISRIELVIDERGKMRDDASYELRSIRSKMIEEQNYLRKRLDQIIRYSKQQGYVKDDASLTVREGRMVIPFAAEHKRKIKGFVHDESATGQTVYLEPAEIIDINNGIRELRYKERREVIRILTELTSQVRPHVRNLQQAYHFLGIMDFIQAKAKFARNTHSVLPKFEKKTVFDWKSAFHPLLYLTLKEQDKKVIPLNLILDKEQRVLLISGPNAGGKSVSLKTVGLLQYMFQSGLLVPMKETSTIGLFKDIFIDIGDEQSIENDLSTYSSHLTSMKFFLKFADKYTLFLIDEFGAGTEPAMGGAISEAILEKLNRTQAFGVITTHYTNLKVLAEKQNGLINGAMQFDADNLEPLYRLEVGKPGSSYAFEIAKKIGLPDDTINRARKFAGKTQVNYDQLLMDLEKEKEYYSTQNRLTEAKESKLKEVVEEYEKLRKFLDEEKSRIINKAKIEAQRILKESNQKIENTIRVIKEQKAEKQITKQVRKELETFKTEIKPEKILLEEPSEEAEQIEVVEGEIQIGDQVRIKGQTALGEVIAIKGKDIEVLIGALKSNIKKNRLEKISRKVLKAEKKKSKAAIKGVNMHDRMVNFQNELDLRGMRTEEALFSLDYFMDDAILLGQKEVRVVHGKGDGILRKMIREHLKRYKEVSQLSDEHADRGGSGVTIVHLA